MPNIFIKMTEVCNEKMKASLPGACIAGCLHVEEYIYINHPACN